MNANDSPVDRIREAYRLSLAKGRPDADIVWCSWCGQHILACEKLPTCLVLESVRKLLRPRHTLTVEPPRGPQNRHERRRDRALARRR